MKNTKAFLRTWLEYQKVSKKYEIIKQLAIKEIGEQIVALDGYTLSVSKRPNFSKVTLEEAREYDAVKKVVNTTKLNTVIKDGTKIHGVTFTPYINVQSVN